MSLLLEFLTPLVSQVLDNSLLGLPFSFFPLFFLFFFLIFMDRIQTAPKNHIAIVSWFINIKMLQGQQRG